MKTLPNYISEKLYHQQIEEKLVINKNFKNDDLSDLINTLNKCMKFFPNRMMPSHIGFRTYVDDENKLSIEYIWNSISSITTKIKNDNKAYDYILKNKILAIRIEEDDERYDSVEIWIKTSNTKKEEFFVISFFIDEKNILSVICMLLYGFSSCKINDLGIIEDTKSIVELINFIKRNDEENVGNNISDDEIKQIINNLK